jgi:hypothetical protein
MGIKYIRLPDPAKPLEDYDRVDELTVRLADIPHRDSWWRNLRWYRELFSREGIARLLYYTGELRAEIPCRDYSAEGAARWFYKSGCIEAEICYENALPHGITRFFPDDNAGSKGARYYFKYYYIRGIEVSAEVYNKFQQGNLTLQDILYTKDDLRRGILLEEVEGEKLFNDIPHIVLDKEGEEVLVQPEVKGVRINVLKVKCSSTGRYHFLRVSSRLERICEAKAWTFGLSEEEYNPIRET